VDRGSDRPAGAGEPRQRWRITFAREPVAPERVGRVALDEWHAALAGSGLPIATQPDGGRARFAVAAPLPAAARGDGELIEIWLGQRLPAWRLREGLASKLPGAHRWVAAEDVWLGAPALPGRVAAAEWAIVLDDPGGTAIGRDRLAAAVETLKSARTIPRVRLKGGTERAYDLRRLLAAIALGSDRALTIHVRTRIDPEVGSGRPEEVVAALAGASGLPLRVASLTRVRLLLVDDLP
jgi:hypothetical protein